MDLNTILIILGIIALIILVVHGLWANRREKSQYFKSANTFTRDSRLREPPAHIQSASEEKKDANTSTPTAEVSPAQRTFAFEAEKQFAHEQQAVEQAIENIKITLPKEEQPYQAKIEPDTPPTSPALTTIAEVENYANQEEGIDTHSEQLRQQLADLAQQSPSVTLAALQEEQALMESQAQQQASENVSQDTDATFIMMYVVAPENYQFQGARLAKILDELGFLFGEHNIYHRHSDLSVNSPVLFSVANIEQPGTFDYNMHDFSTVGIALFMQLPSEGNDLMNLRMMIRAAKSIAEDLGGFVLTDQQAIFDDQAEKAYLDKVR
ncbi:TPA: cell division protein ZipA [Pasteurella multocida]|nr:cell division protein ZipA [Pasteurella multocida]AWW60796.1 cell division protein ZipA [Pasteurellaceae bacterium 12591]AET16928.1 cell division protein ZipA [Pasteurella multocida 36950]AHE65450.1 cell division protein ZipA [Pasteurella multocida subsp. multocida str. HB03]AIN48153.1 cell division protein ZipA [Pasteurella multocida]ANJ91235.1 cell division protein ZipA [Pasteurella multocida subsp. multocida HB01]